MKDVTNFHRQFVADGNLHRYKGLKILAEPIEPEAGGGFNLEATQGPRIWIVSVRNLSAARQLFDELARGFHGSWELLEGPEPTRQRKPRKPLTDRKKAAAAAKKPKRSINWHLRQAIGK